MDEYAVDTSGRSEKIEQSLVANYANPVEGSDTASFEKECKQARQIVDGCLSESYFWMTMAKHENEINCYLLNLIRGFQSVDISANPTVGSSEWLYRTKVVRHLRFAAKLEAISGRNVNFNFFPEYAKHIYPKLLNQVMLSPVAEKYLN